MFAYQKVHINVVSSQLAFHCFVNCFSHTHEAEHGMSVLFGLASHVGIDRLCIVVRDEDLQDLNSSCMHPTLRLCFLVLFGCGEMHSPSACFFSKCIGWRVVRPHQARLGSPSLLQIRLKLERKMISITEEPQHIWQLQAPALTTENEQKRHPGRLSQSSCGVPGFDPQPSISHYPTMNMWKYLFNNFRF